MIELSEKIAIINDLPKSITFPCKIGGRYVACTFLPGENEILSEVWEAVKLQNKARFEAHYGQFLREWKPLNTQVALADELAGGPLSQFARKDGFECLSLLIL